MGHALRNDGLLRDILDGRMFGEKNNRKDTVNKV